MITYKNNGKAMDKIYYVSYNDITLNSAILIYIFPSYNYHYTLKNIIVGADDKILLIHQVDSREAPNPKEHPFNRSYILLSGKNYEGTLLHYIEDM